MPTRAWNAFNERNSFIIHLNWSVICNDTSLKQYLFISIIVGTEICISSWWWADYSISSSQMRFFSSLSLSFVDQMKCFFYALLSDFSEHAILYMLILKRYFFFPFRKKLLAANYCLCYGVSFACSLITLWLYRQPFSFSWSWALAKLSRLLIVFKKYYWVKKKDFRKREREKRLFDTIRAEKNITQEFNREIKECKKKKIESVYGQEHLAKKAKYLEIN